MKPAPAIVILLLALIFVPAVSQAQEESTMDRLKRISESTETREDWTALVRALGEPVVREGLRQALASRENYPRQALVDLLTHPQLAVRLGAVELLEQAAGQSFEYNPWTAPPTSETPANDPNLRSLESWQKWAGLDGEINTSGLVLSEEQMQSYLRDLISGNPERKRRAIRMLDPHSMKAVAAIQQFIVDTPGLSPSGHISLKEAQYHLVINRTSPKTAAVIARDLTRGNRDQQLSALAGLKNAGFLAIPIVRDFIGSPDALVRETAIDTILALGGAQTVPLVAPSLKEEKDINVIHAAMRRLREIGGPTAKDISAHFLDHPSEDMVVSALQTATKLWGGDDFLMSGGASFSGKEDEDSGTPEEVTAKVTQLLNDPRWRVRTAALEFVSKTRARSAQDEVISLLSDDDTFVRANAIDAVVALDLKSATSALEEIFLEDDEMIGAISEAFTRLETVLPERLIVHLDTRPPDAIIAAIKGLGSDEPAFLKIVARYATHPNLDISCSALRSLANDSDKVQQDLVANHLNEALQSGVEEKVAAVLNALRFPNPRSSSFGYRSTTALIAPSKPTALDPLYDAFLKTDSVKEEKKPDPAREPGVTGGKEGLRATLAQIASRWEDHPEHAYRAAFILAKADDGDGLTALLKHYDLLSSSQRAAIADNLYSPENDKAIPLLVLLMQDELTEIRADAAYAAFGSSTKPELAEKTLAQLTTEGSKLRAHEAYGYRLESALDNGPSAIRIVSWARNLITSEARDDNKILALIILRSQLRASDDLAVTPYTRSQNQWLRRAAWNALCTSRKPWVLENLDQLKEEQSPQVRLAFPMTLTAESSQLWAHQFSDLHREYDNRSSYSYSSSSRPPPLPSELLETLRSLAKNDPDPRVQFESWFALLSRREAIDLGAFLALIGEQPEDSRAPSRLANLLERNYQSMGPAMRPLLAFANTKDISPNKLPLILKHFSSTGEGASFSSFEALAKTTATTDGPQQIEGVETPEELAAKRENLKVISFYKPGCRECEKAENNLNQLKRNFPLLTVERVNINEQKGLILNQVLCARLKIPGVGKTPSFFTQAGAAISPRVSPPQLAQLLQTTMETKDDPSWADFDQVEIEEAREQIDKEFSNVTLAIVITGGLLDGINPCAFATIIFFLSYLQIAKRSPREILMVGIAFILAIFLAYFSVGLLFYKVIDRLTELDSFQFARDLMTWTFAAFALLVAVLSLRDGIRASRGNLKDMTLQLPDFLKKRIRSTIRKRARARNYVIAAFITGIIISFLELACTGQVYAPIVYQVQQGRSDAILFLLIYNVAFILPLVVIFILAYRGMTSEALLNFQKNHTASVKYATALLFFLLTLVILFGQYFLPHP